MAFSIGSRFPDFSAFQRSVSQFASMPGGCFKGGPGGGTVNGPVAGAPSFPWQGDGFGHCPPRRGGSQGQPDSIRPRFFDRDCFVG